MYENASPIDVASSSAETNNEINLKNSYDLSPSSRHNIKTSPRNLNSETSNESNDCVFENNTAINTALTSQNSESLNNFVENKITTKTTTNDSTNVETDSQLLDTVNTAQVPQSTFNVDDDADLSSPGSKRLRIASFSSGDESEPN